ncbi:MAG: histidinol phosphate phosphatase domain-containing protein [Spirochaetes bacterium]|nr:histidinol phosphate phosphatase domain-containing protein [Spirochaetota bacterium]
MIDLHTHSILSDGELIPAELVRRASVEGYGVIGITDHADSATLESIARTIMSFAEKSRKFFPDIAIIPGVELTHVPPKEIALLVKEARAMKLPLIVVHGETRAEPVAEGTNRAAIEAHVDILAHPGFISGEDMALAVKNGVHIEITAKKGHSITNGYVAACALRHGAAIVLDSDCHRPGEFLTEQKRRDTGLGSGLSQTEFDKALTNSEALAKRLLNA